MRWLAWFLLLPQAFMLCGFLASVGWPSFDCGALICVFLALFAEVSALPLLLLGAAVGRALVDEAAVPVQILVLGAPVALLLPLRALFYRSQYWWQVLATLLCAFCVPKFAAVCGAWFDQPSATAHLELPRLLWTSLLGPVLLFVLRRMPPLASFLEKSP
jgi:hypothetical protein